MSIVTETPGALATVVVGGAPLRPEDVVEQAMPQCESETEQYRRVPYVSLVNQAVNLYNAKQIDSATRNIATRIGARIVATIASCIEYS